MDKIGSKKLSFWKCSSSLLCMVSGFGVSTPEDPTYTHTELRVTVHKEFYLGQCAL